MGWFKPLGDVSSNPSPNTTHPIPTTFTMRSPGGFLRGDESLVGTDGHAVRALLEVIAQSHGSGKAAG